MALLNPPLADGDDPRLLNRKPPGEEGDENPSDGGYSNKQQPWRLWQALACHDDPSKEKPRDIHHEPGQLVSVKCCPTKVEQQNVAPERYTRPCSYSNHPEWRNVARLSGIATHGTAVPCAFPSLHGHLLSMQSGSAGRPTILKCAIFDRVSQSVFI